MQTEQWIDILFFSSSSTRFGPWQSNRVSARRWRGRRRSAVELGATHKRNGTTTLFADLSMLGGKVISACMDRHRHYELDQVPQPHR